MKRTNLLFIAFSFLFIAIWLMLGNRDSSQNISESTLMQINIFYEGKTISITSESLVPFDWFAQANIIPSENSELFISGNIQGINQPISFAPLVQAQIREKVLSKISSDNDSILIFGQVENIYQILWDAGFNLQLRDHISISPTDDAQEKLIIIERPLSFQINADGMVITGFSNAPTVGVALAENHIALQGLDYSIPNADSELVPDVMIEIVRVTEEIVLETVTTPFWLEYQPVAELEIDSRNVVQYGEYGIEASRIRVVFENGVEVSRVVDETWVAKEPKPQIEGYGTKIVFRTLDTPDGPVEYWRAIPMYATSYSPCRSAGEEGRCYPGTSLGIPVEKGVVAVIRSWWVPMGWHTLYVEGYGHAVIADIGAGFAGKDWLDLGYSDDDFEWWAEWVTVYFTTPLPPAYEIMYILP